MISNSTFKLLALSKLPKIGKSTINQLAKKPIDWDNSFELILKKHLPNYQPDSITQEILDWANRIKKISDQAGDYIISQLDDTYPLKLIDTVDAPAFLFCRGNISLLQTKCIAIIGTRMPSKDGEIIGGNITKWFTNNGWTIVSGLALGVDTIAHRSCIENSGNTIVVLGTNLNKVYPPENENLLNKIILNNGLVVSEYAYDNKGFRSQFVERDRIQAGLSNAVILIQSDLVGGSMHASKAILKYKRFLIVANQSPADILKKHPKIEANMVLINSDIISIRKILKMDELDEQQIIRMMNKNEYDKVSQKILEENSINFKNTNEAFNF